MWVAIDYIFSLGFRVLRGADLGFLEPLVEARCSTTGPKVSSSWPEITSLLLPGQTASDRPALTARVFDLKLKALIKRLSEGLIFRRDHNRQHDGQNDVFGTRRRKGAWISYMCH